MRSRALPAAVVATGFAVAPRFAAVPASAATLPAGQRITVVDAYGWQFYDASPVDAALTPVGEPGLLPFAESVEGVDVDDDGHGYAVTTTWETDQGDPPDDCTENDERPECDPPILLLYPIGATLYVADAAAGTLSGGIPVTILTDDTGPEFTPADSCFALDYTAGVLLLACNIYGDGSTAYIGSVDPDTGRLYPDTVLPPEYFVEFDAIAVSPIDGTIWGFAGNEYGTITLDDELPQYVGYTDFAVGGADFDRDGVLWATAYRGGIEARAIEPGELGLVIIDLDTGEVPFDAAWPDQQILIKPLTVWGKPALPATGPAGAAPIAVGAAALLMLGTLLAAGALLRRRSDTP